MSNRQTQPAFAVWRGHPVARRLSSESRHYALMGATFERLSEGSPAASRIEEHPFCHIEEREDDAIFDCDDCRVRAEVSEQFRHFVGSHWDNVIDCTFRSLVLRQSRRREYDSLECTRNIRHVSRKAQWAERRKVKILSTCVVCQKTFESVAITAYENPRPRACSKKCLGKFGGARKRMKKTPGLSLRESLAMAPKRDRSKACRAKSGPVELNGKKKPLAQWAVEYGINAATVASRIKAGLSLEAALTKPAGKYTRREVAEAIAYERSL